MSRDLLTPTRMPEKARLEDPSEPVPRAESSLGYALRSYAILSILLSLTIRVLHRGPYYPGLDAEGAAGGLFRVATMSASELWRFHWANHHSSTSIWSFNGLLFTLLPGWLASRWPSELWPHLITFLVTVLSFYLIVKALELRQEDSGIVLLGWSASSALLSHSFAGLAYVSSILPYALALWVVFRLKDRWLASLVVGLLVVEVSWHVQELGRTVFLVFLAAGFLVSPAPRSTRAVWLLTGSWACWLAIEHPNFNTQRFTVIPSAPWHELGSRLAALGTRFATLQIDIPVLTLAGIVSALVVRRHRWFWRVLLLAQLGMIASIELNRNPVSFGVHWVWPRRTLLCSFLCVAVAAAAYRERRQSVNWLAGILLVGSLWQMADTIGWAMQPLDPKGVGRVHTLPFTASTDYTVSPTLVDWYLQMRGHVDRGDSIIVLCNLGPSTNPPGILERLYLHLGHEAFMERVFVFGSQEQRAVKLPIRPLHSVRRFVNGIRNPAKVQGFWMASPEATTVITALERRFVVEVWPPVKDVAGSGTLRRFVIQPR